MSRTPMSSGRSSKPDPLSTWTAQECWVWSKVCAGEIADFNQADGYGGELDPRTEEYWLENRLLQPIFLEEILLHEPYRSALTRQGLVVKGAWFKEALDLSNTILTHPLCLERCRMEGDVNLSYMKTSSFISLQGSRIPGKLHMGSLEIGDNLFLRGGAEFAEVDLGGAKVGGQVSLIGSKFIGKLNMNSLRVEGSLLMSKPGEFADVELIGAKVGGQVSLIGSKFTGRLNMNSVVVEGSLLMSESAEFANVDLGSAKVGGQVSLIGSKVTGKLDMDKLQVGSSLLMRNRGEFSEVVLQGANVGGQIDMSGSKFTGYLNMNNLQVAGKLIMRERAEFADVNLISSRIGWLDMSGSKFTGKMDMNSLQVGGSLLMRDGAEFTEVSLISAKIGGQLNAVSSTFSKTLNMNGMQAEGSVLLRDRATLVNVNFISAKIGGQLEMDNSMFTGDLNMEGVVVEGNIFLRRSTLSASEISLIFAKIGGSLVLSGSLLPSLDLTGTKIHGDFSLGLDKDPSRWTMGTKLILRNTEVGALQDLPDSWPEEVELKGFTYERLGGLAAEGATDMATRDVIWLKEWLIRQKRYSPQPYEQLASVLLKSGYKDKANEILYTGKERERKEGTQGNFLYWLWLTLLKVFIGYGYRMRYSIGWVFAFVMLGVFFLWASGQGQANGMPYGIAYSFDTLLPIIKLRELHYKIDLIGWTRYYFYFHKLMGYVLGSFIIAGLSGLTKK